MNDPDVIALKWMTAVKNRAVCRQYTVLSIKIFVFRLFLFDSDIPWLFEV